MIRGYKKHDNGVIKQLHPSLYRYDKKYVKDRYDSYGISCDMMSYLRLGYIMGSIERPIISVLDVGYGNGSFLKVCKQANIETYGTDISNYELKYGDFVKFDKIFDNNYDLITFFDSLEHFHKLDFLSNLQCNYVCISVPYCHYNQIYANDHINGDKYFKNWKHRRPDEHIWHFNDEALINLMDSHGYNIVSMSTIEDIIRKPSDQFPNILTAIFKKNEANI